jgi:hypothetical protein
VTTGEREAEPEMENSASGTKSLTAPVTLIKISQEYRSPRDIRT